MSRMQRVVDCVARHRPDDVAFRRERDDPIDRDRAAADLVADKGAAVAGIPDGAAGFAAEGEVGEIGAARHAGAAAAAARQRTGQVAAAHGALDLGVRVGRGVGPGVHVRVPHDESAGLAHLLHCPGIVQRHQIPPAVVPAGDRHVANRVRPFHEERNAVQRTEHHAVLAHAIGVGGILEQRGAERRHGVQRLRRRNRARLIVRLNPAKIHAHQLHRRQRFRIHRRRDLFDGGRAEIENRIGGLGVNEREVKCGGAAEHDEERANLRMNDIH